MLTNEDISTVLILSVPRQLVLDAQARLRLVQPLNSFHITTYTYIQVMRKYRCTYAGVRRSKTVRTFGSLHFAAIVLGGSPRSHAHARLSG